MLVNTVRGLLKVEDEISEDDYLFSLIGGNSGLTSLSVLRATLGFGGVIRSIRTVTEDDIITEDDYTVLIDASANTVDLSLPANPNHGQIFNVYCIDSTFTCTVLRNGNNINGAASDKVLTVTESMTFQYDSTYGWIGL